MPKRTVTVPVGAGEQLTKPKKPRTKKHIVVPATAEQIMRGVGATKKDIALVRKVMLRLGYLKEESPLKEKARAKPKKKGHKGQQGRQGQ